MLARRNSRHGGAPSGNDAQQLIREPRTSLPNPGPRSASRRPRSANPGGAIAARLWWLLRYFGHGGGRVLDGGIGAWMARGLPLSTEVPAVAEVPLLDLVAGGPRVADKKTVERFTEGGPAVVLDARARERYAGEASRSMLGPATFPARGRLLSRRT
jgi:hypothetical protein